RPYDRRIIFERRVMLLATAALGLMLGLSSAPASAAAPAPKLPVGQILARHAEARGGAARIDAIHSMRFTGRIVFGGGDRQIQGEFGQLQRRPGAVRTEVTLQGLTQVQAYDGKDSW